MKLAILTDEVSQDPEAVLRFAREFALDGIELRSLNGRAFKDLTREDVASFGRRCRDEGFAVAACASPVFKCSLRDSIAREDHVEIFRRSVDKAQALGAEVVRIFTFNRREARTHESELQMAADHIAGLLDDVRGTGIRIGVENEATCLACTGGEMAHLFRYLPNDPQLGIVWDPCNVLYLDGSEDPVHDEFFRVARQTIHVHVKDARRSGTSAAESCVELGTGTIDFAGQFSALRGLGYQGWVTLETHWRDVPLDAETQHLPSGAGFSANAEPASRICMKRLCQWLR